MARILLGVTGSVAAINTRELFEGLRAAGHDVKIAATPSALYFFDPLSLNPGSSVRNKDLVVLDEDEWPGRDEGRKFQRQDTVLHIELRRWAEILLIAPLDANTLAKLANGLADNCLTCVYRAWDLTRGIVLAPAMNTMMWDHPATARHFRLLAENAGLKVPVELVDPMAMFDWIHGQKSPLKVVPPVSKRLACDDVGMGGLASQESIVAAVS